MPLHAISPEAVAAVRKQQKTAALSSGVICILVVTLILLVLSLFFMAPVTKDVDVIVSYKFKQPEETKEKPTPKETVQKKPSAPSAAVAKVITTTEISNVAIPVPDVAVAAPSVEFGMSDDFGSGFGMSGIGGGGTATFFNTKSKAQRVAYVIDYSRSMKGERDKLMRAELAESVSQLNAKIKYQLIFFAGPAWAAGDEVQLQGHRGICKVTSDGVTYDWAVTGGPSGFKPKDDENLQTPKWLNGNGEQIEKSLELIQSTKLVWGTTWEPAISMALRMDPQPDVIFFMTDGVAGSNSMQVAEELGAQAKEAGVIINTVAMMEPRAEKAMRAMAELSGGSFTLIGPDGEPVPDKEQDPKR